MSELMDKIGSTLQYRIDVFVEPYQNSSIFLQLFIVLVLLVATAILNRYLSRLINNYVDGIKHNYYLDLFLKFYLPVKKRLNIALVFALVTEVLRYFGVGVPILTQTYVILFLWVAIRLSTNVIKNAFFRKIVTTSTWLIIILNVLNLYSDTAILLDSLAVTISGIRLSIYTVIKSLLYMIVFFKITTILTDFFSHRIEQSADLNPSIKVLLTKGIRIFGFIIATILFINAIGIDLSTLALFTSALGVGIGFGLQKIVANLISGVTLLLDNSLKPGDVVEVDDHFGVVKVMASRYTSIVTVEGKEHLIPNEQFITNQVINWSHSNKLVMQSVNVGVSYNSDIHLVKGLLEEATEKCERVLKRPKLMVYLTNFGDSSVDFKVTFWINDPQSGVLNIQSEVLFNIWDTLKEHNIEIPFPQRDLHIKTLNLPRQSDNSN